MITILTTKKYNAILRRIERLELVAHTTVDFTQSFIDIAKMQAETHRLTIHLRNAEQEIREIKNFLVL